MKYCSGATTRTESEKKSNIMFYPKEQSQTRASFEQYLNISLPNYEKPTTSSKQLGHVYGFAVNTNQGLNRNYNEDRVSIILNAAWPKTHDKEIWPRVHFFGVFDGHGGDGWADFLRDNLHRFVSRLRFIYYI